MPNNPTTIKRISEVAKELANGKSRGEILGKYAKKWGLSRTSLDRIITNAKPEAETLRNLASKTANDTIIAETADAMKRGLKSKFERLFILQKEVDECLKELYDVGVDNFADIGQSRKNVKKQLTVTEKVKLRQTINLLQAEISKLEGDYAPAKHDVTINKPAIIDWGADE